MSDHHDHPLYSEEWDFWEATCCQLCAVYCAQGQVLDGERPGPVPPGCPIAAQVAVGECPPELVSRRVVGLFPYGRSFQCAAIIPVRNLQERYEEVLLWDTVRDCRHEDAPPPMTDEQIEAQVDEAVALMLANAGHQEPGEGATP